MNICKKMRLLWLVIGSISLFFLKKFSFNIVAEENESIPPYRNLMIYTTSMPCHSNLTAKTFFYNRGKEKLFVSVSLNPDKLIKINNLTFKSYINPHQTSVWHWTFYPVVPISRVILKGEIIINKKFTRDLFIAIQGPDASTNLLPSCIPITNIAEVTATYAPYADSTLSLLKQQSDRKNKKEIILAQNGKSSFVISIMNILPAQDNSANIINTWRMLKKLSQPELELIDALEDLQRCIYIQSGASIPISTEESKSPFISLKIQPDINNITKKTYDAYHLQIKKDCILIEAANLEGLRNGIYGLLTDHLGCHWFQPGKLGEEIIVPPDKTIRIHEYDEIQGSVWFSAGGISWNSDPLWERRNRAIINRSRMNFGHSWANYINEREFPYEKFPDYYARDRNGKIRKVEKKDESWTYTNFCPSNTNVIEIVARKVNAFFDANPDAIVASLDPNDYAPMCLCERCVELDRKYGIETNDGTNVTDRLIHFSNEIYKRLKPEHQHKYLGILIYGYQMHAPRNAKPHKQHAGIICNFPPRYDHSRPWTDPTSPWNADFYQLIKKWGAILARFGYYDYYGHYYYFGPFGIIHKMREDLPSFYESGGSFLMLENEPVFAAQGLNHYISAKLAWDINANVDAIMEEFFSLYYGPAAEPMRQYWYAVERHFALERPGTRTETRVGLRQEFWDELANYLRKAQQITSQLPVSQKRFVDRVKFNADGFEYGKILFEYEHKCYNSATSTNTSDEIKNAISYLKKHYQKLTELKNRYYEKNDYWPPFLPSWSWFDVDKELERLTSLNTGAAKNLNRIQ